MDDHPWTREFPGAITVCDARGILVEMNDRAERAFAEQGGRKLIGSDLADCHPEPSRSKFRELLRIGQETTQGLSQFSSDEDGTVPLPTDKVAPRPIASRQTANVYTTEKGGVRTLVYQAPWYRDGQYAGLVELALEIPQAMPHFVRDE